MPTNRIVVEFEQGVGKCTVWDSTGNEYDCSAIFEEVRDHTAKGRASSTLALRGNNLRTHMSFDAVKKELTYDVAPEVVNQIMEMNG